jgi:ribonuclease VapC
VVIDSSAFLAIHLEEPGWEDLVAKIAGSDVVLIAAPTLLETAMVLSGRAARDSRLIVVGLLRELGAQVVPFTEDHYYAAIDAFLRYGKGRHPAALNFGDCMAYAVASVAGLPLLYVGKDFARTGIATA